MVQLQVGEEMNRVVLEPEDGCRWDRGLRRFEVGISHLFPSLCLSVFVSFLLNSSEIGNKLHLPCNTHYKWGNWVHVTHLRDQYNTKI